MTKRAYSFRLQKEIIDYLREIERIEKDEAEKYQLRIKTKTDILEDAIREYYEKRIKDDSKKTYLNYVEDRLRNVLDDYLKDILEKIDINQIQNIKNTELILLFFKLLKVDIERYKVDNAVYQESCIEEKVDEKNKKVYKRI